MNDEQQRIDQAYRDEFEEFGESPKSLMWLSYRSAAIRYRELVSDLDIDGRSILDAGCGMGDLLPFLYARSMSFHYHGMDTSAAFIGIAKKRYEGERFSVGDPFVDKLHTSYDIVVSSGVMNHDGVDWLAERKQRIARLFSLSKYTLAFNMAGNWGKTSVNPPIAYADTHEILAYCMTLTDKIILKQHYHPQDFTIIMHRS